MFFFLLQMDSLFKEFGVPVAMLIVALIAIGYLFRYQQSINEKWRLFLESEIEKGRKAREDANASFIEALKERDEVLKEISHIVSINSQTVSNNTQMVSNNTHVMQQIAEDIKVLVDRRISRREGN